MQSAHADVVEVAGARADQRAHGYFLDAPGLPWQKSKQQWLSAAAIPWSCVLGRFVSRLSPVSQVVRYRMRVPKPRHVQFPVWGLIVGQLLNLTTCQPVLGRHRRRWRARRLDAIWSRLRSEEHTSELQSRFELVCWLLL